MPRGLRLLMQLVALLFAVPFAGITHVLADVVVHGDCGFECEHEASSDDDRHDRPQGGPSCHAYAHHNVGLPILEPCRVDAAAYAVAFARRESRVPSDALTTIGRTNDATT